MRVQLLGGLEVQDDDGRDVVVAGPKLRALLAVLALQTGRVVPSDQIVDALWGEDPPAAVRNGLQGLASKLRRTLGSSDLVAMRGGGYVLELSADAIDVFRHEQLVAMARAAVADDDLQRAATLLAEADAFWRALRDQESAFFPKESPQEQALWRLSVPSTAKPLSSLDLQGTQLIEWGGAQRWWRSAQSASSIREAVQLAGGHATLIRPASSAEHGATRADGVFTPLSAPLRAIHQQLKTQFDPHGIFNRGRMFSDL